MSHNRTFFHVADPQIPDVEIGNALDMFDKLAQLIDLQTITRVGVRQWSAFKADETFKDLVKLLCEAVSAPKRDAQTGSKRDIGRHVLPRRSDAQRWMAVQPQSRTDDTGPMAGSGSP